MTKKPMHAKFAENKGTKPDCKVQNAKAINPQAVQEMITSTSLYLAYLSSITPKKNEPTTPKKINVAPKMLLSMAV